MNPFTKIKGAFLIIIVFMSVAAGAIIWNQHSLETIYHETLNSVQLEQYLLECRRQEKNFILRQTSESIALFNSAQDSLMNYISFLRSSEKNEQIASILTQLEQEGDNYLQSFHNLVKRSDTIETTTTMHLEFIEPIIEVAQTMHSHIDQIRTYNADNFQSKKSKVSLLNFSIFIVSIFLAVIFAGILSDNFIDQIRLKNDLHNG